MSNSSSSDNPLAIFLKALRLWHALTNEWEGMTPRHLADWDGPSEATKNNPRMADFCRQRQQAAEDARIALDAIEQLSDDVIRLVREGGGNGRLIYDWRAATRHHTGDAAAKQLWNRVYEEVDYILLASEEPPEAGASKKHMKVEEANKAAMDLAKKMGKVFFALSESEQARQIGCSWQTWAKTAFYPIAQKKRPGVKSKKKSPRTVCLTGGIEAVTGKDDEALQRLIGEQQADSEPSPLDPDPPDRPRKVRERKRL